MTGPDTGGPVQPGARARVELGRTGYQNYSGGGYVAPIPPSPPRPAPPSRLAAHSALGFASFATWWLSALVLIPYFDGNRLALVHVVYAAIGAPICAFLWWVAIRTLRAAE